MIMIQFRRQRLFLPVLMGTLLMAAACAREQAPHLDMIPQTSSGGIEQQSEQKPDIVDAARSSLGVPYRYGGTSPATGFDCSGFVRWSFLQVGIQLPRSARDQNVFGTGVERREDLAPGDIVVFRGTRGRTGWHSGIYTGDGKFVHSPHAGKKVTESRLDEEYYARRYVGARRIPRDGSAGEMYAGYEARQRDHALTAKESKQAGRQLRGEKGRTDSGKAGKTNRHLSRKQASAAKQTDKRLAGAASGSKTKKQAVTSGNRKTEVKDKKRT